MLLSWRPGPLLFRSAGPPQLGGEFYRLPPCPIDSKVGYLLDVLTHLGLNRHAVLSWFLP